MTKKVLITGATGFLGGYLIRECLNLGYDVVAFGRNAAKGKALEEPGVTFIQGDMSDLADLEPAFSGVDAVVHAGALSTVWGKWEDFYQSNVLATAHVIELCQIYRVERLVFVSSPSIYAQAKHQFDIKEEEAPASNDLNLYIKSKLQAEALVKSSGLDYVICRPRGLFGVGDTSLIPRLLQMNQRFGVPVIGNGMQMTDVTCVSNVAYAIGLMLRVPQASGQIYNITNGEPMAFKQLLSLFFDHSGSPAHFRQLPAGLLKGLAFGLEWVYRVLNRSAEPPLTRYIYYLLRYSQTLDISKAVEELGYQPRLSIEEGIKEYVAHQKY